MTTTAPSTAIEEIQDAGQVDVQRRRGT